MNTASEPLPPSPAQIQSIIRELQLAADKFCRDEAGALTERLTENLLEASDRSLHPAEQTILRGAHSALSQNAAAFKQLLRQHFPSAIQRAIDNQKDVAAEFDKVGSAKLELIGMEDMEREVLIVNMVRKLEEFCVDTLSPLTMRLGYMAGVEGFQLSVNPFRPDVLVRAMILAWESFETSDGSTTVMLRTLHPTNFLPLNALYQELNELLAAKGVMKEQKYVIKRTPAKARDPDALWTRSHILPDEDTDPTEAIAALQQALANLPGGSSHGSSHGASSVAPVNYKFNPTRFLHQISLLLEHVNAVPGGGETPNAGAAAPAAGGAAFAAPDAQLMARLDALLASRNEAPSGSAVPVASTAALDQLREAPEVIASSEIDRSTIEMVSRVFQYVLADASLPAGLKVLIARLQLPALRAALSDRAFFVRTDHPARQLIDLLAHASLYWSETDSPLATALGGVVDRANEATGDSNETFIDLNKQVRAIYDAEQERYNQRVAASIEAAQVEERKEEARLEVTLWIERRFASHVLAGPMQKFLDGPWRQYLTLCASERESDAAQWSEVLEQTDVLIWSLERKQGARETQEVLKALPDLVTCIKRGLDRIEYAGEERDAFMSYLMEAQTKVIRRGLAGATPPPAAGAAQPTASANGEAAPNETVDEADSDFLELELSPTEEPDRGELEKDQWFEFDLGLAQALRYRLSWISPKRTKFVFTNRDGAETLVKSLEEIEALLSTRAMRALDASPLMERAIAASAEMP